MAAKPFKPVTKVTERKIINHICEKIKETEHRQTKHSKGLPFHPYLKKKPNFAPYSWKVSGGTQDKYAICQWESNWLCCSPQLDYDKIIVDGEVLKAIIVHRMC